MELSSLQVCMDSSDWLQGAIHEGTVMDSSSPSSEDILTCTRPLIERRLRPPHDQPQKCPRCDSTNTKFCYYNNYSLTQPRYFCKSCRRYWTKGGTLRNIPVGGGCRKNKKVSTKKSNDHQQQPINQKVGSSSTNPTDLQLSYPDMQFSHLTNFLGNHGGTQERIYSDDRVFPQTKVSGSVTGSLSSPNFMDTKYNIMLEDRITPIDFMESKYEALVGNGELGMIGGLNDMNIQGLTTNFPSICSPFGMALDVNNNGIHMDNYHQRLMLPYESQEDQNALDVKPNTKALTLDWHDQACSEARKDTFGYLGGLGSWTGLMNGYGSSTTNPLV